MNNDIKKIIIAIFILIILIVIMLIMNYFKILKFNSKVDDNIVNSNFTKLNDVLCYKYDDNANLFNIYDYYGRYLITVYDKKELDSLKEITNVSEIIINDFPIDEEFE